MTSRSVLVAFGIVLASGCGEKSDDAGSGDGPAAMTTGSAPTEPTAGATGTTAEGTSAAIPDACPGRPGGDWNACFVDAKIDNDLCAFTGSTGKASCYSPTSGFYNVCGITDCVDDCDCYAQPATGTAFPVCTELFADGGKGCVLWCVNGQICPDGMECVAGRCYWPNG